MQVKLDTQPPYFYHFAKTQNRSEAPSAGLLPTALAGQAWGTLDTLLPVWGLGSF